MRTDRTKPSYKLWDHRSCINEAPFHRVPCIVYLASQTILHLEQIVTWRVIYQHCYVVEQETVDKGEIKVPAELG